MAGQLLIPPSSSLGYHSYNHTRLLSSVDLEFWKIKALENTAFDFHMEFAFGVAAFSNCTLRLCFESAEDDSTSDGQITGEKPLPCKDILINTAVLAAKSRFFLKLFTSGMKEMQCLELGKPVCIQVSREEEQPMVELLQLMYRNRAPFSQTSSFEHTLQLLFLADRFEVPSCISSCAEQLKSELSRHMTFSRALLSLQLPSALQSNIFIGPLLNDCSSYIAKSFQTFIRASDEGEGLNASELTLEAMQKILKLDTLQVNSEDEVFAAALRWCRMKYESLEARKDLMATLSHDLRFSWMSASFLVNDVLPTPEMDRCGSVVLQALQQMVQRMGRGRRRVGQDIDEDAAESRMQQQPRFSYQPSSRSVFLELPATECSKWDQHTTWLSPSFYAGKGHWLTVQLFVRPHGEYNLPHVGCYLTYSSPDLKVGTQIRQPLLAIPPANRWLNGAAQLRVGCKFAVNFKAQRGGNKEAAFEESFYDEEISPSGEARGWGTPEPKKQGTCNLLGVPLDQVLANKETYFPDAALQLRVDIWFL